MAGPSASAKFWMLLCDRYKGERDDLRARTRRIRNYQYRLSELELTPTEDDFDVVIGIMTGRIDRAPTFTSQLVAARRQAQRQQQLKERCTCPEFTT